MPPPDLPKRFIGFVAPEYKDKGKQTPSHTLMGVQIKDLTPISLRGQGRREGLGGKRQDVTPASPRMRELAATHGDLAKRLAELEDKTEALAMNHDTFSRNTRNKLREVFDALHQLMTPPDPPKRPIGFINPEDKGNKKTSGAKGKT